MATYRFQRVFTPSPNADLLRFLKHRLDDFLGILEKHLLDRSFVIGEQPTVVDLSMIGYLQYPKEETGYGELARRVIALDPIIDEAFGESSQLRYHSPVLQAAV